MNTDHSTKKKQLKKKYFKKYVAKIYSVKKCRHDGMNKNLHHEMILMISENGLSG